MRSRHLLVLEELRWIWLQSGLNCTCGLAADASEHRQIRRLYLGGRYASDVRVLYVAKQLPLQHIH
jgi:hypothetical protein